MELFFQIYIFYLVSTKCFAIIYLALLSLDCSRRQNPTKTKKGLANSQIVRRNFDYVHFSII